MEICARSPIAAFPARGAQVGDQVRLCKVVQGVEFSVDEQGVLIRALILSEALQDYFGASDSPQSWLRAYEVHRDAIDCAAADAFRAQPSQGLVVLGNRPQDFAHVRIPALEFAGIGQAK
jgi:hypothetical protein